MEFQKLKFDIFQRNDFSSLRQHFLMWDDCDATTSSRNSSRNSSRTSVRQSIKDTKDIQESCDQVRLSRQTTIRAYKKTSRTTFNRELGDLLCKLRDEENGDTVLHRAAYRPQDLDVVILVLGCRTEMKHDLVDARNTLGRTALHLACRTSNLEAARLLLKHDADPVLQSYGGEMSAMHFACQCLELSPTASNKRRELVSLLLKNEKVREDLRLRAQDNGLDDGDQWIHSGDPHIEAKLSVLKKKYKLLADDIDFSSMGISVAKARELMRMEKSEWQITEVGKAGKAKHVTERNLCR